MLTRPTARKPRRPRITILGLPYFGASLAATLATRGWEAQFIPHPGRDPRRWAHVAAALTLTDLLYLVSSRAERGSPLDRLLTVFRRPVVIHWVGTDALIANEEAAATRLSSRVVRRPIHWCDAPWLVDELAAMGMASTYVPLPVEGLVTAEPAPLPERFRVLLYLPVDAFDREVFDMDTLLRLPPAFPDVEFVLVPSPAESLPEPLPPNLAAPGWVPGLAALFDSVSVYVRLTSHDGTPFTVLEALSRGRHVIFTHDMPETIHAAGFDAVGAALGELLDRHRRGELALNREGMAYTRAGHHAPTVARDLSQRLREVIRSHYGQAAGPGAATPLHPQRREEPPADLR